MTLRLVRFLSLCGVASRRAAADVVREGVVRVNGEVTTNVALGIEESDVVTVRGKRIQAPRQSSTFILNKPAGLACTRTDPHNPETVISCLPPEFRNRLKPVGRLDKQTTGLLLLTDDGELAFRLTHPSYGIEKGYRAIVEGMVSAEAVKKLQDGVLLEDGPTAPARVRLVRKSERASVIELFIHEGRKRQIRRMCEAVGHRVLELDRFQVGPLKLANLALGKCRLLTQDELESLCRSVKLKAHTLSSE
jgi:23S rRNA pseudouridine2605 synthase